MSDDAIDMLAMDFWTFRNFKLHDAVCQCPAVYLMLFMMVA
jgi:hypothetical protein